MPEQTESLTGPDSRSPHEIAGIPDEPIEREEAAQAAAAPEDSVPAEDGTNPGPDLTWLDKENLRDTLGQILAGREDAQEILDGLKDGYERKASYTRKTQALARERKETEQLAEAGKMWKAMEANPALMDHILAFQKGGDPVPSAPELSDDIFEVKPQQIVDAATSKVDSQIQQLQRQIEQLTSSIQEQAAPVEHIQNLESTLVEWQDENRVTDDVMQAVGQTLQSEYDLRQLTPEALQLFLPRLVHSVTAEKQLAAAQEKSKHESQRLSKARTASPQGGVGVSGHVEMNFEQKQKAQEEKLGRALRQDEVNKLAFQDFLNSYGKSETDLDRDLKDKGYL